MMGGNIIRDPICLFILALAILTLSSCGNGGGSEAVESNNSAKLSWDPPTINVDGTDVTDLAGYKIYYDTKPDTYTIVIDIKDPRATEYTIENLPSGTIYFVITAYDESGNESDYSNTVSKSF